MRIELGVGRVYPQLARCNCELNPFSKEIIPQTSQGQLEVRVQYGTALRVLELEFT